MKHIHKFDSSYDILKKEQAWKHRIESNEVDIDIFNNAVHLIGSNSFNRVASCYMVLMH